MAENDTPQHDRTEQPSAKRLDDARGRGEVPRSRELAMTAVVIAGAAVLLGGGSYFAEGLEGLVRARPQGAARGVVRRERCCRERCSRACAGGIRLLLPVAAATIVAAVVRLDRARRLVVQHRGVDAEVRALESRSPGFGRIVELARARRAREGARQVRRRRGRRGAAAVALRRRFPRARHVDARGRDRAAPRGSPAFASRGSPRSLLLVAAADVPFQFWHHRRQLRMTKQEARDELKETEGRPEVRSRIRSLQRALATRRMMADVPKADVVAMNPTHYAVALRYDAGNDESAARRREGRRSHRVPDPPRRRGAQRADLRAPAVRARVVLSRARSARRSRRGCTSRSRKCSLTSIS